MSDPQLARTLSDIQGRLASLDYRTSKILDGLGPDYRPATGRQFFAMAAAALHRLRGESERADRLIERAATNPAMTSVPGWAQELVSSPVGGLLLAITKQSAYAAVAARTQAFPIGDVLQKVTVGGEITAGFYAEASPINVTRSSLSPLVLDPKKLAAITEITEELLNYGVGVEALVRQLLSAGISSALDSVFFGSAASSAAAPAGILNGLSSITPSALTVPSEAMRADLEKLVAALSGPMDPCFVMAPERLAFASSVLPPGFAYPLMASAAIPSTRCVCVDAKALIAAHGTEPRFAASRNAALHMVDTGAAAIGISGSPNTVSAPTRSSFQENTIALRAILYVAWAMRTGGAAFVDPVAW